MTLFFTSDTHFGHEAIIRLCKRPFASVSEMDEALIARWNETVASGDTVYHLGDFCHRAARSLGYYRERLNGTIHLVQGNHDLLSDTDRALFASVSLIAEIAHQGQRLVLCHYPFREWNNCWRGSWHLFGHVHGRLEHLPNGYSLDVGVDAHEFRPWRLEEIAAVMERRDNPFTDRK